MFHATQHLLRGISSAAIDPESATAKRLAEVASISSQSWMYGEI